MTLPQPTAFSILGRVRTANARAAEGGSSMLADQVFQTEARKEAGHAHAVGGTELGGF
jgi:hypothetical protein